MIEFFSLSQHSVSLLQLDKLLEIDRSTTLKTYNTVNNVYIQLVGEHPKVFYDIALSQLREDTKPKTAQVPPADTLQVGYQLPFDLGTNFVVNQTSWWDDDQKDQYRDYGRTRFVPLVVNDEKYVKLFAPDDTRSFRVRCDENLQLQFHYGDMGEPITIHGKTNTKQSQQSKYQSALKRVKKERYWSFAREGHAEWRFQLFYPSEVIRLADPKDAVMTLDEHVVQAAWVIMRKVQIEAIHQHFVVVIRAGSS